MNSKIVSVLLLLIVAIGFSGVASASTQQVLVNEAWDETVLVSPAWNETIPAVTHEEQQLVSDAYMEQVFDHYLVNGEYTVHHPAVYETVHHPAVYETVVVTDVEAWDEQVLVTPEIPAYDETIQVEADHSGHYLNAAKQLIKPGNYNAQFYSIGTVKYGFKVVDDVGCGVNKIWVPVFENKIVHHPAVPAVYETVHHEAITHEEQVLVSEAYDEQVLVTAAYDEQVAYSGNGPYFNEFGNSDDLNAWVNFIYSHPGATGGWGSWVAYYVSTFHPAVYETVIVVDVPEQVIEHPAVYETIHHPAEYKTVEIADPAEPNEFPLKDLPTGGSAAAIALVIIGILVGGYLASRK